MAVGALGVTLAGFAGLIAALERREGAHSPVAAWRIRNVVEHGFAVTFVGFGTVALYATTQNVTLTVRLATIGMVLMTAAINRREALPGPAWPNERGRRRVIFIWVAASVAMLVNIIVASVGYLQLLLLFQLTGPASIFRNAVADVAEDDTPSADGTDEPKA